MICYRSWRRRYMTIFITFIQFITNLLHDAILYYINRYSNRYSVVISHLSKRNIDRLRWIYVCLNIASHFINLFFAAGYWRINKWAEFVHGSREPSCVQDILPESKRFCLIENFVIFQSTRTSASNVLCFCPSLSNESSRLSEWKTAGLSHGESLSNAYL